MRLDDVENQKDYDELMTIYHSSEASTEIKEEAIKRAKAKFPQYDRDKAHLVSKEVLQSIKESEAEVPTSFD